MCSPTQDPATGQWECPRGKDYPWESVDDACERCGEGEEIAVSRGEDGLSRVEVS